MNKFKKTQLELAIQQRILELLVTYRGFSRRKLYGMAKKFVTCKFNRTNAS